MVYGTGLGIPDTWRVPDGYGDGMKFLNPSGIGYGYGDRSGSRGQGLGKQYPSPPRPIAMSNLEFNKQNKNSTQT